jgi:predicted nucleic acid-binding protein
MIIFVDTSALYALMDANDKNHERAGAAWTAWLDQPLQFATSNYVLLESVALIQHRLGMQAVRAFCEELTPVLRMHWIDAELHATAFRMVMAVGQRDFSLVDATNVELMHRLGTRTIFAFDCHYPTQGLDQRP